jgi:prephenate dehydrogenase
MEKALSKITIIGLGLIGGSIAKALKKANFEGEIVGIDTDLTAVAYGLQNGLITSGGTEITTQVKGSDLVILATHLRFFGESIEALLKINPDILVTDVGSVKSCDIVEGFVSERGLRFIGGHPLAGSEKTGIRNADETLFLHKPYYVLPYDNSVEDTRLVLELVSLIGGNAFVMEEIEHDKLVSFTSHIPHLLAALQVNLLAKCTYHNVVDHVGAGFKDATRIAASSPDLWADIMMFNKKEILLQIEHIQNEMTHLAEVLGNKDRNAVYDFFDQASKLRKSII